MCGLAGIVTKSFRKFDYATFCTLGIANDSRGGDSCGVYIDGQYGYGVKDDKFFSSYFQDNEFLESIEESMVALVHCRKASVGIIDETTAQPVVITKDGNVEMVVMHNGTIYNYKDLAEKYIPKVNIVGMTDSQVMAHIFYFCGYDVLNEYNGGAAFVIVDYRSGAPRTFLFKGASKKNYYNLKVEEERPLYYCIDKEKEELVFSSIWMYLMSLRRNCTTYSVNSNELVEFTGKELVTIAKYPRSKMQQDKEYIYPYGGNKHYYKNYDDWYDSDFPVVYSNYISVDLVKNVYSYKGKRITGKLVVDDFGRVNQKDKDSYPVYFFDGVALKNQHCYKFLLALRKESTLSNKEFFSKFENVIRFLSIDGLYLKDNVCYKAVTATTSLAFTGSLNPISSVSSLKFIDGKSSGTIYNGMKGRIKGYISEKLDFNFKAIKEECKSLMK